MFYAYDMKRNCKATICCSDCKFRYMCKTLEHFYELNMQMPCMWTDEDCKFVDDFVLAMRDLSEVGIDYVTFELLVKKFNI